VLDDVADPVRLGAEVAGEDRLIVRGHAGAGREAGGLAGCRRLSNGRGAEEAELFGVAAGDTCVPFEANSYLSACTSRRSCRVTCLP
jgi:hypothetical protein